MKDTENKEVEQQQEVNQTQKNSDNMAEIRKSIEERYEKQYAKKEVAYKEQIARLEAELKYNNETLPAIQEAFKKANGNINYFNDFVKLAKDKLDMENLEKSITKVLSEHKWAINNNGTVHQQLNASIKNNDRFSVGELEPHTIYRKRKI